MDQKEENSKYESCGEGLSIGGAREGSKREGMVCTTRFAG